MVDKTAGKHPSRTQLEKIEYEGCLGSLGVVLVVAHGGGGDGGARGCRWWQWMARKVASKCLKIQQRHTQSRGVG